MYWCNICSTVKEYCLLSWQKREKMEPDLIPHLKIRSYLTLKDGLRMAAILWSLQHHYVRICWRKFMPGTKVARWEWNILFGGQEVPNRRQSRSISCACERGYSKERTLKVSKLLDYRWQDIRTDLFSRLLLYYFASCNQYLLIRHRIPKSFGVTVVFNILCMISLILHGFQHLTTAVFVIFRVVARCTDRLLKWASDRIWNTILTTLSQTLGCASLTIWNCSETPWDFTS